MEVTPSMLSKKETVGTIGVSSYSLHVGQQELEMSSTFHIFLLKMKDCASLCWDGLNSELL